MVLVTAMLPQKHRLREIVGQCRVAGKRILLGGPFLSTTQEEFPEADHIFLGEAEETLPQFVKDFELGQTKRAYQGSDSIPLSIVPTPDYSLINFKDYTGISIQYSRGCPHNCEFCDIPVIYGNLPRIKSNAQLLRELDTIKELGYKGAVFIVDDNFIGNKKGARTLLPDLVDWQEHNKYTFSFFTEATVLLADDVPLMELMAAANFERVFLGIETPVEESLMETQKFQNTKRSMQDSVREIQAHGMEVMAGFIVGFDNDPPDFVRRQIDFIEESAIPLAMVGLLGAAPGTPLWHRLEKEGRLLGETSATNLSAEFNFVPVMDTEVLVKGYEEIVTTIYAPAAFYNRTLRCLSRLPRGIPQPPNGLTAMENIKALLRIIRRLGFRDEGWWEFWKFFLRALIKYPNRIAQTLRLAVQGYHIRRVIQDNF